MNRADFTRLIEELLEQPAGSLNGRAELEAVNWDSLKALEFIDLVDQKFDGYQVSPDALAQCASVDDLVDLMGSRVAR